MKVVVTEQAKRDIRRARRHYRIDAGLAVADKYYEAFKISLRNIEKHPFRGSPRYGDKLKMPMLRTCPLKRFPYLVFYITLDHEIRVLRIWHMHQDIPSIEARPTKQNEANGHE